MATSLIAKNTMLDALTPNLLKLHSGAAGDGTQNVIPTAEVAVTYSAASGGTRDLSATATITVPAGNTVSDYSVWNGATMLFTDAFDSGSETYTQEGQANVTSAAISLPDA